MRASKNWIVLPCPFCGGMATFTHYRRIIPSREDRFTLSCQNRFCLVTPKVTSKTKDLTVTAWNKRGGLDCMVEYKGGKK